VDWSYSLEAHTISFEVFFFHAPAPGGEGTIFDMNEKTAKKIQVLDF
jgi:hypothetical protein